MTKNICYYPPQSYNEYIKNTRGCMMYNGVYTENTRGCMMYNGVYTENNTIKKGKEKINCNFNYSSYFSDEKDKIDGIKKDRY